MTESKRAALYLRVSTDMQELDNQRIALRKYAETKGWMIANEYTDIMTGSYAARAGFRNLFNDAHKALFDVVLFWDLSRFSRRGVEHTIRKLTELDRLGIEWVSYQEKYINTVGEWKDVIISVFATVNKLERLKISERTKEGLRRIRSKGKKLGRPAGSKDNKKRVRKYFKKPEDYDN